MERQILSEDIKKELIHVLNIEKLKIQEVNQQVANLAIEKLGERECDVNAPVATDGGDSIVSFVPLNIEVIRVADSKNEHHILEFIPLSSDPKIFPQLFENIDVLRDFLDTLNIKYQDVSYFLPQFENGKHVENDKAWDNSKYAGILREVLEWAVLLKLAKKANTSKPNLIIKDGLLRSLELKDIVMQRLGEAFKKAYQENGTLLVGVAKKSRVLNYISMSITINNPFAIEEPCYCRVSGELETSSYSFARRWMFNRSFGELHLAKLSREKSGLIIPVDIPEYILDRTKEILEYLVGCSKATFPTPGYPYPLIKAHDNAAIKVFEKEVWYTQLVNYYQESLKSAEDREHFMRFINLYKDLGVKGAGYSAEILQPKNRHI